MMLEKNKLCEEDSVRKRRGGAFKIKQVSGFTKVNED